MQGLGVIVVASAGTPQVLSATKLECNRVTFQPMRSLSVAGTAPVDNSGHVYILNSSAAKGASSTNVLLVLAIGQPATTLPSFAPNGIDLNRLYVDADNSSDGVLVSYA